MLSILILSQRGEGNELITKLKDEGHFPKIFQAEGKPVDERYQVNRYQDSGTTSDMVIAASAGSGGLAESIPHGRSIVVGSRVCKLLVDNDEIKRALAKLLDLQLNEGLKGPEIIYGGWFHPSSGWLGQYVIQEYNRMLDNNRGPYVSGVGYVVSADSHIHFLESATSFLKDLGYHGWFGVRFVATDEGLALKCFDTDFASGYLPAVVAIERKLTNILQALAHGSQLQSKDSFALSIAVAGPVVNKPSSEALKYMWYKDGVWIITSSGATVREARRRAHRTLKNHMSDESVYRSDIGKVNIFEEDLHHGKD